MDKSKHENSNIANTKKPIEKQYNETNINKLFEQAANTSNLITSDQLDMRKESFKSNEEKVAENLKKELQATEEKDTEKANKAEENQKKNLERIDIKRPSYQMEVEKMSLSITKINISEIELMNKKENSEIQKDPTKTDLNNEENGMSSENKIDFNTSSK